MTGQLTPGGGAAGPAIAMAARRLGLADPVAIEWELTSVDVDGLARWFELAGTAARAMSLGGGRLGDVLGSLAAGWSSPAPRVAVMRQWDTANACSAIVRGQLDAVDGTCCTLRQTRSMADGRTAAAATGLLQLGWPVTEDLLIWAAVRGQLASVTAILATASEDLSALRARNEAALHDLAVRLRTDPGEPLATLMPMAAAGGRPSGGLDPGGPPAPGSTADASPRQALQAVDALTTARLTADLHSTEVATVLMALGVTGALARARDNGSQAALLVYESASAQGQGRAAISVGDLAAADHVAIVVPGIGNAPAAMADAVSDATALRAEAQRQAPTGATAVVAWYGYDIPLSSLAGVPVSPVTTIGNAAAATDDGNARSGGAALMSDLAGFRQLAPGTARWVAIGFSMGSTTVSAAAAGSGTLDDIVLLGSPGASTEVSSAADYRAVTPEHTFVTSFDQDPVTNGQTDLLAALAGAALRFPPQTAPFGPDPATRAFGAQVIDAPSNAAVVQVDLDLGPLDPLGLTSVLTNEVLDLRAHHQQGNYLGGQSLEAVAAVVIGHYSDVPIKPGR